MSLSSSLSSSCRFVAIAAVLGACQLPLDHAACPCAAGWVCCATSNVCAESVERCDPGGPRPDGAVDGDPTEGDGPAEVQRLQPQHAWVPDQLGSAVALLGDVAAVAAPLRDGAGSDRGAVAVFERRGGGAGVWIQVAELTAPEPVDRGEFGAAIGFLAQDALLVGSPGASGGAGRAYLFRRTGATWAWRQTLAPDLTGVPDDKVASLGFGARIAVDLGRAVVQSALTTQLYELTPDGASALASIAAPGGGGLGAVALRGSSIAAAASNTTYEFQEATGWAAPVPIVSFTNMASLAFDGQRLAVWRRPGSLQILERADPGWTPPVELAIPIDPDAATAPRLAWQGDALLLSGRQANQVIGLWRVRPVAGTWQVDPVFLIAEPNTEASLVVDGDRAMVGLPRGIGRATLFHVDDAGFTARSTFGFDDPPATGDSWLAAASGHILVASPFYFRVLWFERDAAGYRRRPSLVLDDDTQLLGVAVAGNHALVEQAKDQAGAPRGIQSYELRGGDWTRGELLTPPDPPVFWSTSSMAVDGDTAVVAATRGATTNGLILVYTWSGGAWTAAARLETGLPCFPRVAIAGARVAAACGSVVRVFARVGAAWHETPAPKVPEPEDGIRQVMLAGDLVATSSSRSAGYTIDVARWADGHWHNELHVRADRGTTGCLTDACSYGLAALAADRVVMYRDPTSVARYRFADGAWRAEPLVLPAAPQRSPNARVAAAALSGDELILSVTADGDGVNTLADAIYVFPGR